MFAINRINCSIIILCFEWKIGKFENVQIFKHYRILIMACKKDRNHFHLKRIENYCRTKTFPKRLAEKGRKQILHEPQSDFPLKMDNYITKIADLSLQIRIVKSTSFMISMKGQVILVTQKQRQLLLGKPQHTKSLPHASMLRTTYKNVIVVKDKVVCHHKK